ncbi:hypothetical protein [Geomonas subterranea]|uniref:hypothetical protein n=1 Tax=Geomonas subterranea TaxID=2847989 RepID=UPI001CD771EB|nr:hypothetical protein [Geomonas fuzhouensis]
MKALHYENLIRRAFGFAQQDGRMIDRWADPATLANTDAYSPGNLSGVKVGAGYAMEILTTAIINHKAGNLPEGESDRLDGFTSRVIDAEGLDAVSAIIDEFSETVEERYFEWNDGIMSLK